MHWLYQHAYLAVVVVVFVVCPAIGKRDDVEHILIGFQRNACAADTQANRNLAVFPELASNVFTYALPT